MGSKKIEWISTLRGIAALLVFISHLYLVNGTSMGFIIGRIGVVWFFLIIGYLSHDSRKSKSGKQYLFNRFVRMYPVYWILLLTYYIVTLFFSDTHASIISLLFNMTLFEEFLGLDCILGGSWMMPIQIAYFIIIGIFGTAIWCKKFKIGKFIVNMPYLTMTGLMLAAIITGILRHITGIPLPAAFLLLMALSFYGLLNKSNHGGYYGLLIIFEVGLIVTSIFAYDNEFVNYIIAYNIGIGGYIAVKQINSFSIKCFDELGKIGFTFFLGADTLYTIVSHFVDFADSIIMIVIGYIIKFILAVIWAYIITRFVEKPLLKWARTKEKLLN